jgi:hypothetical protein
MSRGRHFSGGGLQRPIAFSDTFVYRMKASEDVVLGLGRGTTTLARRYARCCAVARRSPLTAFVVAFSLIVQLFAAATPPGPAAPAFAGADEAAIAAELKAVFGDAAELCAHVNDHGPPGKHAPFGHCCDQCQLCRFAAQAVAFVSPDAPSLPQRIADSHAIRAGPDFLAPFGRPAQSNRARAPPLAV